MRRIAGSLLVLALGAASAAAQQAKPPLSFEVASVKVAGPLDPQKMLSGQQRVGMKMDAGRVDIESLALADLINIAFKTKPYQVSGPSWLGGPANAMTAQRFDIHATLPAGATTEQVPEMLQSLLAERFKLTFHREQKEQSVFALVVGKNGSKLQASAPEAPPPADAPAPAGSNRPDAVQVSGNPQSGMTVRAGNGGGAMKMSMTPDGIMHLLAEKLTLAQLADSITQFVGRPVVDMTGLTGSYRIALDLSREDLMAVARAAGVNVPAGPGAAGAPGGGPADPTGTSVFQSVENLGLKLDSRKSPIDLLVIDRLEKTPTED